MVDFLTEVVVVAPLNGVHAGSGEYNNIQWDVVQPGSVPGPSTKLLSSTTVTASAYCYFFKVKDPSILPSHFAVAVSPKVRDFSNINLFFHPVPGAAHPPLDDSDYPMSGNWSSLYRYTYILGLQLSASDKQQILVMPFLPGAIFSTTGDLVSEWRPILTDIARQVQGDVTGKDDPTLRINSMAVSSFSAGIQASAGFRGKAKSIIDVLVEVWDLDGLFSSQSSLSNLLSASKGVKVIQYQQRNPTRGSSFFIGAPRWYGIDQTLKSLPMEPSKTHKSQKGQVHAAIPKKLFYHAATISAVG